MDSRPPLRHGSYRRWHRLAIRSRGSRSWTNWLRAAQRDPLEFRLAHLEESRLRTVLEDAAKRFNWKERVKQKQPDRGVGLACGTRKGIVRGLLCRSRDRTGEESHPSDRRVPVVRLRAGAESGESRNQMEGAIIMGLGPALRKKCCLRTARSRTLRFAVPRAGV